MYKSFLKLIGYTSLTVYLIGVLLFWAVGSVGGFMETDPNAFVHAFAWPRIIWFLFKMFWLLGR